MQRHFRCVIYGEARILREFAAEVGVAPDATRVSSNVKSSPAITWSSRTRVLRPQIRRDYVSRYCHQGGTASAREEACSVNRPFGNAHTFYCTLISHIFG